MARSRPHHFTMTGDFSRAALVMLPRPQSGCFFFHEFDMFGDTLGKLLGKALFSFQLFLLEVLTHAVSPNLGD